MKKFLFLTLFLFVFIGFLNLAQSASFPYPLNKPIMSCNTQRIEYGKFSDPCSSLCDLLATAQNAIYFGITLTLVAIAPIFFVIGGIMIITSQGDEGKFKKGKEVLTNAVWGVVIVLAAFVIVNTVIVILAPKISGNVLNSSWSNIQCKPEELPGTVKWQN
jgi:hypothetical protein